MKYRNVLALSPHTDDTELGCGGTIARLVEEGANVHIAAFSTAEESIPSDKPRDILKTEFLKAAPKLGVNAENLIVYNYPVRRLSYHRQEVLEELVKLKRQLSPDLVFLPSGHDVHQDHQVLHAEGLRAFKDLTILGYELPWNHVTFSAHAFMVLEERHIQRKWDALQNYQSQLDLKRPYFSKEFVESVARMRGTMVGTAWAEAFEVIRIKWNLEDKP